MKRKKTISSKCMVIIALLMVITCGCGREKEQDSLPEQDKEELAAMDLSVEKWKEFRGIEEGKDWYITKYVENISDIREDELVIGGSLYAAYQDLVYRIEECHTVETDKISYTHFLHVQDTVSMEDKSLPLLFHLMENASEMADEELEEIDEILKTGYGRIVSIIGQEEMIELTVFCYNQELNIDKLYYIAMTTGGRILQGMNLAESLWKEDKAHGMDLCAIKDGESTLCVIENTGHRFHILDDEGRTVSQISLEDSSMVYCMGKTVTGRAIFYEFHNGKCRFFKIENGNRCDLTGEIPMDCGQCWMDWTGNIYYSAPDGMFRWNTRTGECSRFYGLEGINFTDCKLTMLNSRGQLFVFLNNGAESFCYEMSKQPLPDMKEIKLLTWAGSDYLSNCAAEYMRRHPGVTITVETMEEMSEYAINRLAEKMKSGEGPDLLVLRRQELEILQGAGCLEKLNTVIPEDLKKELFQGALEYGRINGTTYGIPYDAMLSTLLVSEDEWQGQSWTIREAMELFREKKRGNRELECFWRSTYPFNSEDLLVCLLLFDLEYSSFLDMEHKTCDFQNDEFKDILEFCKEYGEGPDQDYYLHTEEKIERALDGSTLSVYFEGAFAQYSYERSLLGEKFHDVGFPISGTRVVCYNCVAESAWAENREICEDFIASLLGEKNQINYSINWIRKDVLRKRVREHTELSENPVFMMDGYNYIHLGGRKDGSSYLEEYIERMDHGKPLPALGPIENIILEETGAYFAGDKSAEEVTELIQRRVQLYFDEQ